MEDGKLIKNDLLLRAARREKTERTPVWMMRQAGRFDPQYMAIRQRSDLQLEELFRNPELATEISLLPKRFGVDAIIFFQDILTPLAPMEAPFLFRPGPVLSSPIRNRNDVKALRRYDVEKELPFVSQILRNLRDTLNGELPLLGFAGSPLTLAMFLIEGKSPGTDPVNTRAMMKSDPVVLHELLDVLSTMTVDYLKLQIQAGADAVQLFESVADLVSRSEYEEFAHPYHVKIFSQLSAMVPTILFVKEQPFVDLMVESGANVLSVGSCVDIAEAKKQYGHRVAFQGNVNNETLRSGSLEEIEEAVRSCIRAGGSEGHILNLNHGLFRDTPVENVCRLIDTCKLSADCGQTESATSG